MSAIDAIGIEARQVLLEVMMSVAWADRELAPEERQAANAAAMALGLVNPGDQEVISADRRPIPVDEIDVSQLKDRDRELIFLCAAWMAMADNLEQSEETDLLGRMRTKFGLDEPRAAWLKARAVELRAKQTAERSTWWRAFDRLVVEAARALPHFHG